MKLKIIQKYFTRPISKESERLKKLTVIDYLGKGVNALRKMLDEFFLVLFIWNFFKNFPFKFVNI